MRIAYLCDISPEHTQPYSGGNARIYNALRSHVGEVDILPQSWGAAEPVRRLLYSLPDGTNLRLRWRLHLLLGRIISRHTVKALDKKRYDVLFCPYSFQSLSHLRPSYKLVKAFTSDATFTAYKRSEIGQTFGSSWLSRSLLDPLTLRAEKRIFGSLDLALWPSDWIKSEADALYDLSEDQSLVVPWGANIDPPGQAAPHPESLTPLRLLFIGRDWFAKGGPLAFETLEALKERGIDARLTVIGTTPPPFHQNAQVQVIGPLDKSIPAENTAFEEHLRAAHFLMQPSFESWGFAFCEAAAFGLPSLCLRVGGVPVQNGITGHALPSGSTAQDFVECISHYLNAPEAYSSLRKSAREDCQTRLNWDSWARSVKTLLEEKLAKA